MTLYRVTPACRLLELNMNPDLVGALRGAVQEEDHVVPAERLHTVSPNQRVSRDRARPPVEEIDRRHFSVIDSKLHRLTSIPEGNPGLRRATEETHYRHIYDTVAIDGSTLTLPEVRQIIETHYAVPGKSLLEQSEAIGMDAAMKHIDTALLSKAGAISVADILQVHLRVLGYADPVEAGRLRTCQVYVGRHVPPHHQELQRHLEELVGWLNSEAALRLHPVEYAALTHYRLVDMLPFRYGNGRTARLLMNMALTQSRYPPITIRKEQRVEYFRALDTANQGDVRPFIRFIAKCTEITLDSLLLVTSEHPGAPRDRPRPSLSRRPSSSNNQTLNQ